MIKSNVSERKLLVGRFGTDPREGLTATPKRCCLLYVKQRAEQCHRSVVADAVALRNPQELRIVHL